MTLMESFEFVDGAGRSWRVPSGTKLDGASIPKAFWSLIGGPFEGKYRNASVIHDHFCDTRRRKWQDVHKVFYDGMLASGVDNAKAYLMYKAVEKFGPRWEEPTIDPKCLKPNGQFNFDACTENNAVQVAPAVVPPMDKQALRRLIDEVGGVASPEDLAKLKALAD